MSDPGYAAAILFPVFASIHTALGMDILLVSVTTEWLNIILKWFLMEHRPYWWVAEYKIPVTLKQTENTCDTTPGSPSGHVMGAAALLYVFSKYFKFWIAPNGRPPNERLFNIVLWIFVSVILITVSISRINVATHFPHQCLFGAVFGILSAKFLMDESNWSLRKKLSTLDKKSMLCVSSALSAISFLTYFLQRFVGLDPGWSIKLAFKWCQEPTNVSVHTTPIFSLIRDCGCLFGISLAWPVKLRSFFPIVGAVVATLFFVSVRLMRPLMPSNDPFQFYTAHFLEHLFISFLMLTVIPYIASLVKTKEKSN